MGRQYFAFLFRQGTEQEPHQGDMNNSTSPNMFLIKNKYQGRNQIALDLVQLFCNSFCCVQHKMVGDDYPFILQCIVYHKKGTVHHWVIILIHPKSCPLFMFVEPLHKYLDDSIVLLPLPTARLDSP